MSAKEACATRHGHQSLKCPRLGERFTLLQLRQRVREATLAICTRDAPIWTRQPTVNILVVSNMYPTPESPISGIFVHEQVKALRKRGHDVRVASGKPLWLSGRLPTVSARRVAAEWRNRKLAFEWVDLEGVPCVYFRYFAGALARPSFYPNIYKNALAAVLPRLRRDFNYELVHTHTAFLDGRAGALAASHAGVPLVLTEHTGPFSLVTNSPGLRRHTLAGFQAADSIIAVSDALRAEIALRLPSIEKERIVVVPNGVDAAYFSPEAERVSAEEDGNEDALDEMMRRLADPKQAALTQKSLFAILKSADKRPLTGNSLAQTLIGSLLKASGLKPTRSVKSDQVSVAETTLHALWVGHLVDVKRVDRLVDAFAIAHRNEPRLRLTLLGSGSLEGDIRQRIAGLSLEDVVVLVPQVSRFGVRAAIARSDFIVISSETETFGIVGIEALAMGRPVLATDCGGPREYLDDPACGLLVGNSMEDLAIGLAKMSSTLDRYDQKTIRNVALRKFDFSIIAHELTEVYEAALRKRKAKKPLPEI